jgi:hypothetical protein
MTPVAYYLRATPEKIRINPDVPHKLWKESMSRGRITLNIQPIRFISTLRIKSERRGTRGDFYHFH